MSPLLLALALAAAPTADEVSLPRSVQISVEAGTSARPPSPWESTFAALLGARVGLNVDTSKLDFGFRFGALGRLHFDVGPNGVAPNGDVGGYVALEYRPLQLDTGIALALSVGVDLFGRHLAPRPEPWSVVGMGVVSLRVIGIFLAVAGGGEQPRGGLPAVGVMELRLGIETLEFARFVRLQNAAKEKAPW